jgi:hypothetical protein
MTRLLRTPAVLALSACAAFALATPWDASAAPAAATQDEEYVETPLSLAMEQMKGAARRLERVLQGDDAETALGLLADFQAGVVAAKGEAPLKTRSVPEAEQATFVRDYRSTMVKLLRVTCDLEQALLEGRMEDARGLFEGELKGLQKPGHERFRDEE